MPLPELNTVPMPEVAAAVRSVGQAVDNAADKAEKFGISSTYVRTFLQLGFAGLVAYLFWDQSGTNKEMMSGMMLNQQKTATDNAVLFRDEVREQRKSHWESTKLLREGLDGVKRAVEQNTEEVKRSGTANLEEIKKLVKGMNEVGPPQPE